MRFLPLLLLLLAGGCAQHRVEPHAPPLPLQPEPSPFTFQGSLGLTVDAPRLGVAGSTSAVLRLRRPDAFALTVLGPVGGVLLEAAASSSGFDLLLPKSGEVLHEPEPDTAIRELTRGAVDLDGLLALLTGRLPASLGEPVEATLQGRQRHYAFEAPEGRRVLARTNRRGVLQEAELLDADGSTLLSLQYEGLVNADGYRLPEDLSISVPPLDLRVQLHFRDWQVLGGFSDFSVHDSPDFTHRPLREAIEEWRSAQAPQASP